MKKLMVLAGILTLSVGSTSLAGDRLVAYAHGGQVFQRDARQNETTVALYTGDRDVVVVDRMGSDEPTQRKMIETSGRSGYRMHIRDQE